MATTIEELQILLKCDATQAQAALESLQTAVDKTVKKMTSGTSGESKSSPITRVAEQAEQADKKISSTFSSKKMGGLREFFRGIKEGWADAKKESEAAFTPPKDTTRGMKAADALAYTPPSFAAPPAETRGMKASDAIAAINNYNTAQNEAANSSKDTGEAAKGIEETGKAADNAAPKVDKYSKSVKNAGSSSSFFGRMSKAAHSLFSKFGSSFKKHEGFLSKFGKTLKRVIMRMMAMGLVRGVIRGFTQGLQMLAKASPAAAEQFGRFTAMTKAVKAALGSAALAVLNAFASVLYNVASAAVTAANAVARFFGALGGGKYFAVSMADGFDNLSDSMSGAGGAAKGMLADFDELNVIGQQGGGGGGNSMSIGNATVSEQDASSIFADLIKNDEFEKAGEYINKKLGEIADKISNWFTELGKKNYGTKFAQFLNGIFSDPTAFEKAGKAVGNGINTVFDTIYNFLSNFDAAKAAQSLARGLNSLVKQIDFGKIGTSFGTGINTIFSLIYNFFTTFDFRGLAVQLGTMLSNAINTINWDGIGETIITILFNLINFLLDFVLNVDWGGLVRGVIDVIVSALENLFSNPRRLIAMILKLNATIGDLVISLVGGLVAGILDILGLDRLGDKVRSAFDSVHTAIKDGCAIWDEWAAAADTASENVGNSVDTAASNSSTAFSTMNGVLDGASAKWNGFAGAVDGASQSVDNYVEAVNDKIDVDVFDEDGTQRLTNCIQRQKRIIDNTADSTIFIRGKVDELADSEYTLSGRLKSTQDGFSNFTGLLDEAKDGVDGLRDSINKIPTSKTTSYTFKANVEATASGSSTATVNKPNINVNLTMASGGIAYGETLARIGEYPNAHTNPEVVAPLNKLQGILEKANGGNKANSADVKRQNELLTEQNRLLRIIAQKEIKLSPSPELGQVVTKATALYGAV